ncbi:MAG: hypothetical protein NZ561_04850 [Phycisphaerae bacterium]|nr:hypothetical protein [Phycisphaerae bacterium]
MWARTAFISVVGGAITGVGCTAIKAADGGKPVPTIDEIPPATRISQQEPVAVPPQEQRPVKAGSLPLVYLLEHPGDIRVINATTGVVVASTRAGGRTILKIDADGVSLGGRRIRSGPLDRSHRFEIYLSYPSENIRRTTFERR